MHNTPGTPDPEFDDIINTETWGPYGTPVIQQVQPGLTRRGKAALTIGAAVLAGGGLLTWQHYSAETAAADIKAQELQYKRDLIALELQKELNKASATNQEILETQSAEQQKQIQACVNADKGLIGKQLGVTYASVLEGCRAQYGTNGSSTDMQQAASATDAGDHEGGISPGALIGIGTGLALLVGVAANRGKKTNAA
ncbi:hypothetical protein [Streptomyces glaucescens]|uniref:hypothetical protein n=1 Tax=Streptomyces glaucescens TaxID=1907 RepID=UPI000A3C6D22|nr:hypothetical protein [Streptomyces glaucescens]